MLARLVLSALLAASALGAGATEARKPRAAAFGAIAHHSKGAEVGWATDRRTSREAGAEALKQCGHPRCEIAITVQNACAALARGPKQVKAQKGVSRQEAEARALSRCGEACEVVAWTCTK
jgi:hypothetical protein